MSDLELTQYQIIAARRQAMDALMWQVPALSITAQAFLFSIALDSDRPHITALSAATLALFAALSSIQLMSKHRLLEVRDSVWLEKFEHKNEIDTVHAKPIIPKSGGMLDKLSNASSFKIWRGMLIVFATAAISIFINLLSQTVCGINA